MNIQENMEYSCEQLTAIAATFTASAELVLLGVEMKRKSSCVLSLLWSLRMRGKAQERTGPQCWITG